MNPAHKQDTAGVRRSPAAEYEFQLGALDRLQQAAMRRGRAFGISKLAIAILTLLVAGFLIHHLEGLLILIVPAAVFVVLVVLHERTLQGVRYRARAIRFYEDGLARLNDSWAGRGETGEGFLDPAHPYARDLDVFGPSSVFQYLSTARTRTGEEILAQWLLQAVPAGQIPAQQTAVRDLAERLGFRERIASAGESVRSGVHPDSLAAWGEAKPVLTSTGTRVLTSALAILWILSIAFWIRWDSAVPALLMSLLNFGYAHRIAARLGGAAGRIERAADDLRLLAAVLALIEDEQFSAPRLTALQHALKREGISPSRAIRKLARLADLIESRHSLFARPLDLVTFWSAQLVFLAERWQRRFGPELRAWIGTVGELEALASLSSLAFEHPDYAFPEFVEGGPRFDAECLAHPLLPMGKAVENDLCLDSERLLMILSGPNMAGKSTFIRAAGVNAVLAQCGAPVRARKLIMSPLRVAASICILDSLSGGVSRFYAEIRRVKMIADMAQGSVPVLFLLDELLSGTNSHDRLIGTEFVLRELVGHSAIGIVSTHDLALTRIPESMGSCAFNSHFEDQIEGEALIFDYKLKPGVVRTSNALKLMRAIGLGV
jgi:MutS domain V